jgi:iron complex outermembrane receptor protein
MQPFKSCGRMRPWAPTARLVVALCACLLFAGRAAAQGTGRIEGRVVAKETGEPLHGVTVEVQGGKRSSVTDAAGAYRITGVTAGPAVIVARFLGRTPQQMSVTVPAESVVEANFTLTAAALQLSDVVVTASREQEKRVAVPASIGVIDGGTLRATDPNHPSEVMNRIAGVYVRVTNGEGHMTSIRQPITTDPVYLYLEDGIPTRSTGFFNHNALYEVNLPQADRIEVIKGPATALYGSDAIGGVINVSTRGPSSRPEAGVSLVGGSYNWGRLLATGSNTWGGTGVRADLNLTRTDGWRDSTSYDRQSGTVRWDQRLGANSRLKSVATFSRIDQQSEASSISLTDYLNDPAVNYSPFAVRQVKAFRLSTEYEQDGASHSFAFTPYARYDEMRLIPNWTVSYDPSDYTTQNKSLGALIKYRKDFPSLRTRVIVGADVDFSPGGQVEHQMADVRPTGSSIYTGTYTGTTLYDYDVTYHGVSPYLQVEVRPVERIRLDAGVRVDESGYNYTNNLAPLDTGRWRRPADTTVSYSHVSPKLGATYQFAEAFNVFTAYRHGFRAPSQGQLFRQGSAVNTVGLQPVKVNSYEIGVRGRIARRVDYDVSLYSMIKTDDILSYTFPEDGHTETQNAGRTTHRGIETSVGVAVTSGLRLDVAYSYSKHMYADWKTPANVDLSGKEIVQAPRAMGTAGLTFGPPRWNGARLGIDVELLGSYWEDQANTPGRTYAGYTLYNLRASSPPLRGFVVSARLMNVTNERYSTLSAYTPFQGEQFAPGMGRRLYVTTEYNFQ